MYEKMRNAFISELSHRFDQMQIAMITSALDKVAGDYEIKDAEKSLAIYQFGLPEEAKVFLVTKKMEGHSDGTLRNYRLRLESLFREIHKPLAQITANDLRLYLYRYQEQRKCSLRTLDKYREYIHNFFRWCCDEGYLEKNPVRTIGKIKFEIKPRKSLSRLELEYLRKACKNERERCIIEVLFSTGCRISELVNLKISDIDFDTKAVHLFGKGKKYRDSFLNAQAIVAVRTYLDSRDDDCPYLIASQRRYDDGKYRQTSSRALENLMRQICSRTKIEKKITPHVMRHTTATLALQSGCPITTISKLLGHESINTTMIYAKVSNEDVATAHQKFVV